MEETERFDVAVVGAGVIGCATARALAGDHDVVVLERDRVAGDTTGKASGLVTTAASFHPYPGFAHHTVEFFREYDGTGEFEFHERPRVQLVPREERAEARELAAESAANGFDTRYHDPEGLDERFPGVFAADAGGIEFRDTGWVDPYTYTMTLKEDAEDRGAEVRTGVEVEEVLLEDGAVAGVETDRGRVRCDGVVVAAAWRTRRLLEGVVEVPVRPFRWQSINLDPGWDVGEEFPMCYDPVSQLYWRPELNGELHVGGGEYPVENPGSVRETINEEFRQETARVIPERLSGFEEARAIGGDTCPTGDATTPDQFPIVAAPDEAEGLVVSTGFHIGGIMCSPAAAAGARAHLTGEEAPFPLEPFALSRFDDRSDSFPFVGLMADHTVHAE